MSQPSRKQSEDHQEQKHEIFSIVQQQVDTLRFIHKNNSESNDKSKKANDRLFDVITQYIRGETRQVIGKLSRDDQSRFTRKKLISQVNDTTNNNKYAPESNKSEKGNSSQKKKKKQVKRRDDQHKIISELSEDYSSSQSLDSSEAISMPQNGKLSPMKLMNETEWENEIARNILKLYSNKITSEIQKEKRKEQEGSQNDAHILENHSRVSNKKKKQSENEKQTKSIVKGDSQQEQDDLFTASNKAVTRIEETITRLKTQQKQQEQIRFNKLRPKMIWFHGNKEFEDNWNTILRFKIRCSVDVCDEVFRLKRSGKSQQYILMIESILHKAFYENITDSSLRPDTKNNDDDDDNDLQTNLEKAWKKLIMTCHFYYSQFIDKGEYSPALELLDLAYSYVSYEKYISSLDEMEELASMINMSYAHYYAKRNKARAALQYVNRALRHHVSRGSWDLIGECFLQKSFVLWQLGKGGKGGGKVLRQCQDALSHLYDILNFVMSGHICLSSDGLEEIEEQPKEEDDDSTDEFHQNNFILVMLSIHNMACQQYLMGNIGDACLTAQNARRLAQMKMNDASIRVYSSKIETTYSICLSKLQEKVKDQKDELTQEVFSLVAKDLFAN